MTDPATSATEPADPGRTSSASANIPGAAPRLAVDGFDGPLDLLLVLARAQQIDLARLSIAALIEAFGDALQAALTEQAGARLEHWAVWTVMAASLTELWSRLKLPPSAPEARAAAAEGEALRRQLIGRAEIEAAASWLAQRPHLGQDVFRRGQPRQSADDASRGGDLTDLLRACLPVLRVPEAQAVALGPRPPPLWTATDALRRIARLLAELPNGSPLAAFLPKIDPDAPKRPLRCRAAVASTLIASLELARDGTVALEQDGDWMPIRARVTSGSGNADAPDAVADIVGHQQSAAAMELAASLLCGRPQVSLAEIGNRGADQERLSPPSLPDRGPYTSN